MNPVRPWHYTYVLLNEKAGKFYTGATSNLKNRLHPVRGFASKGGGGLASNGVKGGLTG